MAKTTVLWLNEIMQIVKENGIQIDDEQIHQIKSILIECNEDRNRFITELIDCHFRRNNTRSNARISKDIAGIIIYKSIKNTDLNTDNVIHMASMIIPRLNKGVTVDIEAVSNILQENEVNGNVFAKGTPEYLNSAKFSRLFKPLSNWKDTKGVYSKFWKQMSRWEVMKTTTSSKAQSESEVESTATLLSKKMVCSAKVCVY